MMDDLLERRLQDIENRLHALEAARPTRAAAPVTKPTDRQRASTPDHRSSRRRRRRMRPEKREWESYVGVAVLGRVGIAAVVLAAAYFAQLAYRGLDDVERVAAIYGLSALLIVAGAAVRRRAATRYVALLWGGGAAVAYLAGLTAHLLYGLVGPVAGFGMLAGAAAIGQVLAHRLRHSWLASTTLAGAFAAPLIVTPFADPFSVFLPCYVLVLHGWSAWSESRWGWKIARAVGVVGTVAVGSVWYVQFGLRDAATVAIASAYLIGLVLPELIAAAGGRTLASPRRTLVLLVIAAVESVLWLDSSTANGFATPAFGLLAGGCWTAVGLLLLRAADGRLARGLVSVGGTLLVLGSIAAPDLVGVTSPAARQAWMVSPLVACALGMIALRRAVGVGDGVASAAALIGAFGVWFGEDPNMSVTLAPVAALPAAGLLLVGRSSAVRVVGVVAGLVALWGGLSVGRMLDPAWLAVGLVAGAAWLAVALAAGHRSGDRWVAAVATIALVVEATSWWRSAFAGVWAEVPTLLVNSGTITGSALVAVAGGFALWQDRRRADLMMVTHWIVAIGVLFLIGERELWSAIASLDEAARNTWHVAYLAVFGTGITGLGRWLRREGVEGAGLIAVLAASGVVLLQGVAVARVHPAFGVPAAVAIVVVAAAIATVRWLSRSRIAPLREAPVVALAAVAIAWGLGAHADPMAVDLPLWNLRTAAGLGVVAAAWLIARVNRGEAVLRGIPLQAIGIASAYFVGYAEVVDAAADVPGALPAVLVSVYSTGFAAVMLVLGFLRHEARLRYPALAIFVAVAVKIAVHDLAAASLPQRILATGVLGAVLLTAAFVYSRSQLGEQPGDGTTP